MALDTYSGLLAEAASWLNREDLTARIPGFVALAEARFNRELRAPDMEDRDTTTATTDYVALPSDFLELVSVRNANDRWRAVEYVSRETYYDKLREQLTDTTRYFTLVGNNIVLLPFAGETTIEITYLQRIPALADDGTTNWLLDKHPDLYLYGTLAAAEAYLQNDERLPFWEGKTTQIIAAINQTGERSRYPRGSLVKRGTAFG